MEALLIHITIFRVLRMEMVPPKGHRFQGKITRQKKNLTCLHATRVVSWFGCWGFFIRLFCFALSCHRFFFFTTIVPLEGKLLSWMVMWIRKHDHSLNSQKFSLSKRHADPFLQAKQSTNPTCHLCGFTVCCKPGFCVLDFYPLFNSTAHGTVLASDR